ncbi:MAG: DUF255 domain-containing protein [Bacteroidota bacterium]
MKKRVFLCIGLLIVLFVASAFHFQTDDEVSVDSAINWVSWDEVTAQMSAENNDKKIFVYIHRDFCAWCEKMEKTTFSDPFIVKYINENFYPVKFNLEHPDAVEYRNKTYKLVKSSGRTYHELASYLTMGSLGTPSSVFLGEDGEVLQPLNGYKDQITFEIIMTYYGENHFTNTPWSMYKESYVPFAKKKLISVD